MQRIWNPSPPFYCFPSFSSMIPTNCWCMIDYRDIVNAVIVLPHSFASHIQIIFKGGLVFAVQLPN